MPLVDVLFRKVEKGDQIVFQSPQNAIFVVDDIEESMIVAPGQKIPQAMLRLTCNLAQPIMNLMGGPNIQAPIILVVKASEIEKA
jgi:hypothetical protein